MTKKIVLVYILILSSFYLFGCGEEKSLLTTTTTTTTASIATTTTTSTTTTTASTTTTSTTTSTTTTSLYSSYNMSSSLDGTILSMTQLNGYLYIATSSKLYKVSTSNPTTITASKSITNQYVSMMAGNIGGGGNSIAGLYDSGGSATADIYTESLILIVPQDAGTVAPSAIANYDHTYFYAYGDDNKMHKIKFSDGSEVTSNINETGIISLEYANSHFYACNPTTIYKYGLTFGTPTSLAASLIGSSTNLIGIAYISPYIWVIDATSKKLYRVVDNL